MWLCVLSNTSPPYRPVDFSWLTCVTALSSACHQAVVAAASTALERPPRLEATLPKIGRASWRERV